MAYTSAQLIAAYTAANNGVAPDAATSALLSAFAAQTQTGQMSDAAALSYVINSAQDDVQVAVQAYQFFTGAIPSGAGLDYLTNSTANPNDLNDAYYAQFNLENRYINFAANLGLNGEGAASFASTYGGLSFTAFVDVIYETIIGSSYAAAAGINVAAAKADIASRYNNFVQLATQRGLITASSTQAQIDMAVKASVVGYLMAEGVKADVGIYAAGANNFVNAMVNGNEAYGANLILAYSSQGGGTGSPIAGAPPNGGGQTFNLTAAVEQLTGTVGNDIINGTDANTQLDVVNGGAGADTFNYADTTGGVDLNTLGLSLSNVEVINVRSAGAATATTTAIAGVETLNVSMGTSADVEAAGTTDINVAGVTGAIVVDGGNDVTVNDSTAGADITIGATTVGTGKVTVTDSNVGAASISVDGGTDVTLTLTGTNGAADDVKIGQGGAASDQPSGAVVVTSSNKAAAGVDETLADITITGGSSVSVTQSATSSAAAKDAAGATVTQGDVTITAGAGASFVGVTQTKSTTEVAAVAAVAGVTETATVEFTDLTAGDTIILGGLTFTADVDMTAEEVAQAFANLAAGATQGAGTVGQGFYDGALAGWTTGAANGDTVVFTSTTANANVGDLANTGTGAVNITVTAGSAATKAVTGVLGVATGTVVIDDNATAASLTTVVIDGYGNASTIGATNTLSKLTTLSLANSGSTGTAGETDATMTVDAAGVATLGLTINNIKGAVSLDGAGDGALKTLNVTATGANSTFALTAAAVETLTVAGDKTASFTADLAALKSVTVTGSAGLTLAAATSDTITSVNTSGTTGTVTTTIDAARATYTGGAGKDVVTLATSTALTKAVNLGGGDDTLSFAALNVATATSALNGGDGTDTIEMTVTAAGNLDGTPQTVWTGFERLSLSDAAGTNNAGDDTITLDLANLGMTQYVLTSGTVDDGDDTDVLVLDKLSSGGTVVLRAAGVVQANVTDAATGKADSVNVVLSSTGNLAAGTFTAANVETVNVSTVDTETGANPTKNVDTLTLTANAAQTVNVSGAQHLTLTLTGSTKVTAVNASTMTGNLTVEAVNTTAATTITGGSGDDQLTAATGTTADVLIGGAGDDELNANAGLTTMTGGAGNDLFVIDNASLNVNSYATITDFSDGDLIEFTGAVSFQAARVVLGDTAVFQDFANAAINSVGANEVAWFQYGGNTYIVMDAGADETTFNNGQDFIVKLTGLVDLTNASFNNQFDTIGL